MAKSLERIASCVRRWGAGALVVTITVLAALSATWYVVNSRSPAIFVEFSVVEESTIAAMHTSPRNLTEDFASRLPSRVLGALDEAVLKGRAGVNLTGAEERQFNAVMDELFVGERNAAFVRYRETNLAIGGYSY